MSRWDDNFENSQFYIQWKLLKELVQKHAQFTPNENNLIIEYQRFIKAYTFIDEVIDNLQKDLILIDEFNNVHGSVSTVKTNLEAFFTNQNLTYIQTANKSIDNVLGLMAQHHHYSSKASAAVTRFFNTNRQLVEKYLPEFREKAEEKVTELVEILKQAESIHSNAEKHFFEIENFHTKLFEDEGISQRISELRSQLNTVYEDSSTRLNRIIASETEATKNSSLTKEAKEDADTALDEIKDLHSELTQKLKTLNKFYHSVFGDETTDSIGLKDELDTRKKELDFEFEKRKKQFDDELKRRSDELSKEKEKFDSYVEKTQAKIEELLEGATTASLSSAFRAERKKYNGQIWIYSGLFYASVGAIFWGGYQFTEISIPDKNAIEGVLIQFLIKTPMVAAAIWLATFSARRRAEAYKLQQEYSHKVAVTSSYEGFKRQIEGIEKTDEMLPKLMDSTLASVKRNPLESYSETDKENHPAIDFTGQITNAIEKGFKTVKDKLHLSNRTGGES